MQASARAAARLVVVDAIIDQATASCPADRRDGMSSFAMGERMADGRVPSIGSGWRPSADSEVPSIPQGTPSRHARSKNYVETPTVKSGHPLTRSPKRHPNRASSSTPT